MKEKINWTIRDAVKAWLSEIGADGLANAEHHCFCSIGEIINCDNDGANSCDCVPALMDCNELGEDEFYPLALTMRNKS